MGIVISSRKEVAASAKLMEFQAGQVVNALKSRINKVYFLVGGRLEGALLVRLGVESHCDTLQRGSVVRRAGDNNEAFRRHFPMWERVEARDDQAAKCKVAEVRKS